jgi:hypothetical protein
MGIKPCTVKPMISRVRRELRLMGIELPTFPQNRREHQGRPRLDYSKIAEMVKRYERIRKSAKLLQKRPSGEDARSTAARLLGLPASVLAEALVLPQQEPPTEPKSERIRELELALEALDRKLKDQ